ncbi:serine carboxypeptidase-like 19 isoform X3 [Carex rostrata]
MVRITMTAFRSLLSVFLLFLCISNHRVASVTVVKHLPGFNGPLSFYLETGYVLVDEVNGGEIFYYFVESEGNPAEDPILLWLTGGERCSAFSGLAYEIGNEAGQRPLLNLKGYLVGNPSTGESFYDVNYQVPYAHGVGIISDQIYEVVYLISVTKFMCYNQRNQLINSSLPSFFPLSLHQVIQRSCRGEDYTNPNNVVCAEALDVFSKLTNEEGGAHILEPICILVSPRKSRIENRRFLRDDYLWFSKPEEPPFYCRSYGYYLSYFWANDNSTREALGIKKGTVNEWLRCRALPYEVDIKSSIKYHLNLTSRGYRALVYSGDHDSLAPFLGTQAWVRSLNFTVVDGWRAWHVDGQTGGFTETYSNNLTFATIKGGGHTAPEYQPKECMAMFGRWISNQPL